jgi:hypothetical protein
MFINKIKKHFDENGRILVIILLSHLSNIGWVANALICSGSDNKFLSKFHNMNLKDVIKKIEVIANKSAKFKIGKTGQKLQDRFSSEYAEEFDEILPICSHKDKNVIDKLEKQCIEYFTEQHSRCENDQTGGGDMGEESDKYRLYVVVSYLGS